MGEKMMVGNRFSLFGVTNSIGSIASYLNGLEPLAFLLGLTAFTTFVANKAGLGTGIEYLKTKKHIAEDDFNQESIERKFDNHCEILGYC
jgi:hypothetical protein